MENDENPDLEQENNQEEGNTFDENQEDSDGVDYKALYEAELLKKKLKRQRFAEQAKENPKQNITRNSSSDDSWKKRMELKVDGYSESEVDFIMKNGGRKALENPIVVKAVEAIREQKKAEAATIESSPKSETEKRYSPEEFSKLPADEQVKVLSSLK